VPINYSTLSHACAPGERAQSRSARPQASRYSSDGARRSSRSVPGALWWYLAWLPRSGM